MGIGMKPSIAPASSANSMGPVPTKNKKAGLLVREVGFEPTTSCAQGRRATGLRYTLIRNAEFYRKTRAARM
jgi:hypothetical protein